MILISIIVTFMICVTTYNGQRQRTSYKIIIQFQSVQEVILFSLL